MSNGERSAWVGLAATILILGPYFAWVWLHFRQGRATTNEVWQAFTIAVVAQAVASIVAHLYLHGRYGSEPGDERDAAIELTSYRRAYGVLLATVVAILAMATWLAPISLVADGQLTLLCIALSELTKHGSRVWCYRHGLQP